MKDVRTGSHEDRWKLLQYFFSMKLYGEKKSIYPVDEIELNKTFE